MMLCLPLSFARAAETVATPQSCIEVFGLRPGTRETPGTPHAFTKEQCDAYKYLLETRNACGGGKGITGVDPKDCIRALDPNFVVSLRKMFEGNPAIFGGIKILSGYRTAAGEKLVSGKTTGSHRRGCAVDLTGPTSSNVACLGACRFIQANSATLKLALPYFYSPEFNHVEPLGSCSGGRNISPNSPGNVASPSAPLSDTLRKLTSGDQPPSGQSPSASQPSPQPQPAPQPQPSIPSQPGGVSPTQLFRDTPTPTPTPIGTPAPIVTPGTKTGSSTSFDTQPAGYDSSVADKLLDLAYGTPLDATSTAIATSVPLTIDGSDVGGVGHDSALGSPTSSIRSTPTADPYALTPTNTFVSPELSGGPYEVVASYRGEPTGFIALLIQLRDAFAALLRVLRPMGIREAIMPSADQEEAFIELEYDPKQEFDAAQETADEQGERQLIVE